MGKKILITGGAGFIGSNFVRFALAQPDVDKIRIIDKLTYAGSKENLKDILPNKKIEFIIGDIARANHISRAMKNIDYVVNFAAESHVDRSIRNAKSFLRSNVEGVRVILETARKYGTERIVHISTDEVYGPKLTGSHKEKDALNPSNPYSASKASADMLCNAYFVTFGVPVIIARPSNNYGTYQFPEKFVPRLVTLALEGKPLPLYGDGKYIRDWLWVGDNCEAIWLLLQRGTPGEIYNIGANEQRENIEIAERILNILKIRQNLIRFVADRPGHDRRYCVDFSKIRKLGWSPKANFDEKFEETVLWYKTSIEWWEKRKSVVEKLYENWGKY